MTTTAAADRRAVTPARPDDQVLILFGATGDLARRKLLPGLFHLAVAGMMPKRYRIVGSGRPDGVLDAEGFRALVREALAEFGRHELTEESWVPFAERLSFAPASLEQPDALVQAVARAEQDLGDRGARLVYLAVPPDAFGPMVGMLGATGLSERSRLIVEKPFGHDLASARTLNQALHTVLEESQIFRIDHFLGKEAVQNILAFRFANGLFEPVWNRRHVDYVQIDVPELLTIDGRAGFFEQTGTFRDMVVTHLLHVLGFIAMETAQPTRRTIATRGDREGVRRDQAARPRPRNLWPVRGLPHRARRGGRFEGRDVRRARGADRQRALGRSAFPAAHRQGSGPEPPYRHARLQEARPAAVQAPRRGVPCGAPERDLVRAIQPGVIWIDFLAKQPGASMDLGAATLTFRYGTGSSRQRAARLRTPAPRHDARRPHAVTSADGIERLWEVAAPLLDRPPKPLPYPAGSWGPGAIDQLVGPHHWHLPYH